MPLQRVMILEVSQYLENYLWPNFDPEASSFEHVMSMILMVNEKVCCCCTTALIWVTWCFWLSVRVCSEIGSDFFFLLGYYIVKILLAALLIRIIDVFFYDRVPGQLVPTLISSTRYLLPIQVRVILFIRARTNKKNHLLFLYLLGFEPHEAQPINNC